MIGEQNGKDFNPFEFTNFTIASIVTRIVTGVWYGPHDAPFLRLNKAIARMFELMGPAGLLACVPIFSAVPSPTNTALRRICRDLLDFVDEAIEAHMADFDPDKPANDFIGCYLKAMAKSTEKVQYQVVPLSTFEFMYNHGFSFKLSNCMKMHSNINNDLTMKDIKQYQK